MNDVIVKNPALMCGFCKKSTDELIDEGVTSVRYEDPNTSKSSLICEKCIHGFSSKIVSHRSNKQDKLNKAQMNMPTPLHPFLNQKKIITPKYVYDLLEKSIIGQNKAKRDISLAVATHFRRIENPLIKKSNILLLGPTGSGKTELARIISSKLKLPIVIADATTFTAHGYQGEDVESILVSLLKNANGDLALAEKGIVFLDEIDKIAQTGKNEHEVNNKGVQKSLLKILEGGLVKIKYTLDKNSLEPIYMNTQNILFIGAGAFSGLEEIINKDFDYSDIKISVSANLNTEKILNNHLQFLQEKHLISYGLMPEFLGRFPVVTITDPLSVDALCAILKEPTNSLSKQYQELMDSYGIKLEFTDSFYHMIALEASKSNMGARSLRKVMEEKLADVLFYGPDSGSSKIIVSDNSIEYLESIVTLSEEDLFIKDS